ncbi:MAG: LPD29 domain-containing protein [Thiotrichaceae bacterium]
MKYEHSQAAALIRKELKANGIPAKVRSESYSMGSSISVRLLNNPLPITVSKVTEAVAKYQYGHFNGMEDIYEHSNSREDIPQAKHVFVEADYTDDFKQLAWDHIRNLLQGGEEAAESYKEANSIQLQGEWAGTWVHRVLSGSDFPQFWSDHKQRIRA